MQGYVHSSSPLSARILHTTFVLEHEYFVVGGWDGHKQCRDFNRIDMHALLLLAHSVQLPQATTEVVESAAAHELEEAE